MYAAPEVVELNHSYETVFIARTDQKYDERADFFSAGACLAFLIRGDHWIHQPVWEKAWNY